MFLYSTENCARHKIEKKIKKKIGRLPLPARERRIPMVVVLLLPLFQILKKNRRTKEEGIQGYHGVVNPPVPEYIIGICKLT